MLNIITKMKRIFFLLITVLITNISIGQSYKQKVVVWVDGKDEGINIVLSDKLLSAITSDGRFVALERSADFLRAIRAEIDYERGGNVADDQIVKIGRQYGADLVCAAKVSKIANTNYVSARILNIETAQVMSNASIHDDFKNIKSIIDISERLASQLLGTKSKSEIAKEQEKHVKNLAKENNPFFTNGHNNYLAWGILNTGYPFTLGTCFMGRHGNIIGIGYYLSIGVDFGGKSTYHKDESIYTPTEYDFNKKDIAPLHYSAGLKFFPYKDIFLSVGYGTLGCKKTNTFNDSEGRWGTDGWRQGKGLIFTTGYDVLVGNLRNGNFILSASVGVLYDTFLDEWYPLVNIKMGVAWSLNN